MLKQLAYVLLLSLALTHDVDDATVRSSDEDDAPHGLFSVDPSDSEGPFIDKANPHDLHVIIHLLNE